MTPPLITRWQNSHYAKTRQYMHIPLGWVNTPCAPGPLRQTTSSNNENSRSMHSMTVKQKKLAETDFHRSLSETKNYRFKRNRTIERSIRDRWFNNVICVQLNNINSHWKMSENTTCWAFWWLIVIGGLQILPRHLTPKLRNGETIWLESEMFPLQYWLY